MAPTATSMAASLTAGSGASLSCHGHPSLWTALISPSLCSKAFSPGSNWNTRNGGEDSEHVLSPDATGGPATLHVDGIADGCHVGTSVTLHVDAFADAWPCSCVMDVPSALIDA